MTKRKGSITVKKIVHEKVSKDVFGDISLRELSRRTGIDVAYLSRVRSGKSPITEENLQKILKVTA
jgi:DNA-binding Xre family transcriptional regulator